jgi:uncharacterized membrane protein
MNDKVIVQRPPKSPGLAGILAGIFPGAGALYNREYMKGIIYIIIFAGLVTVQEQGSGQPFFGILLGGFWLFQLIEAVQTARRINLKALKQEEEFNGEGFIVDTSSGSILWGAILIVLGAIFLLANYEVITYAQIARFWPAGIILIGIKLITDYFRKNKQR